MTYKIELSSDEVPKTWYNMLADLPVPLPAPKNSEGKDQINRNLLLIVILLYLRPLENCIWKWVDHLHWSEPINLKNI